MIGSAKAHERIGTKFSSLQVKEIQAHVRWKMSVKRCNDAVLTI